MAQQYIKEDGIIRVAEDVRVYTNVNIIPRDMGDIILSLIAFGAGCIIMSFFVRHKKRA